MRRSLIRSLVAVAALGVLAALGVALTSLLSPERLRELSERRLAELTRHPVSIGRVQLSLGVGIQVRGEDVELWPGPSGPGVRVERVAIGFEPLSLLTGHLRLRRMLVEGAEVRVVQEEDGGFRAPFGFLGSRPPTGSPHPGELLQPLIALENAMRFLLERPHLASSLRVTRSRVRLVLRGGARAEQAERTHAFSLVVAESEVRHRRLRGDAVLSLEGHLFDRAGALGSVRWSGIRDRRDQLHTALTFSGLDLAALEKYLREVRPRAALAGRAVGTLAFTSPAPGHGRIEAALSFDDLEAQVLEESAWGPLRAEHLEAEATLEITPERVELEDARIDSGDLALELDGTIQRPLRAQSPSALALTLRDLDVGEVRALLDWLPYTEKDELQTFVAPLVEGRLRTFTARGNAPLAEWEGFLAGRRSIVAMGIGAEADFRDVALQVGDHDRIEELGGHVVWSRDRVEVRGASGSLNGQPLPLLDLTFEGVSQLVEVDPSRRVLDTGALPLPGVIALWRILGAGDRDDESGVPLAVDLEVDWLHHPVFLWPLENLRVAVGSEPDGLVLELEKGTWAGVPIQGEAVWKFEPELYARVTVRAGAPEPGEPVRPTPRRWAQGRFRVGTVWHPRWRQSGAEGSFTASAGSVDVQDLAIDLVPAGRVTGSASLDLSRRDSVPFQLSLAVTGAQVDALARQLDADAEVATGSLDAWGSFEGTLSPDASPFARLSGLLQVSAADGLIQQSLPPIVAIALASEGFNPFAEREAIRYRSAETLLEFSGGRVSTQELAIDGPDMRVAASGSVELTGEEHEIQAEVALFLFRQLDRAVGSIPLLNVLLLGKDQNLLAAYFELSGPWARPESRLVPLKSLAGAGPASLVFEGVPNIVRRGLRALGSVLGRRDEPPAAPAGPADAPWEETPWGS